MKKIEKLGLVFCLLITFSALIYNVSNIMSQAQLSNPIEYTQSVIGVHYLIDGNWIKQFKGEIIEINQTALEINWFKYNETTKIKTTLIKTKNADNYEVDLEISFLYSNQTETHRTFGEFRVYWFINNELVDVDNDSGILTIRDKQGVKRDIDAIDRNGIRIFEYKKGGLNLEM